MVGVRFTGIQFILIHPLNFLEIRRPPLSYIKAVFIQLSHSHKDENNLYNRFKVILFVYQYVARTQWTGKSQLRSYHNRHLSEYEKAWPHSTRNQSKQEAGRDLSDCLGQSTKCTVINRNTHSYRQVKTRQIIMFLRAGYLSLSFLDSLNLHLLKSRSGYIIVNLTCMLLHVSFATDSNLFGRRSFTR